MTIIFFIKSNTVELEKYNIKDIPGSSGRLDVISRCILAALIKSISFEKNIQIWVFLERYGTYIFSSDNFNYEEFPKNEILFTDCFVRFLKTLYSKDQPFNPLNTVKKSEMGFIEAIAHFKKSNYNIYLLQEQGKDFFIHLSTIKEQQEIVFILGSQEDEFLNSEELLALKVSGLSFGDQSYLASSIIRLLKLYILGL
jgi:tRNA (pseudouridine54-N1)-methyltransferase